MDFDILVNSTVLSFSLISHYLTSPFTCNLSLSQPSSLLGPSVLMLNPGTQESATADLNSEPCFLDSLQPFHKHLLFLHPTPLQLANRIILQTLLLSILGMLEKHEKLIGNFGSFFACIQRALYLKFGKENRIIFLLPSFLCACNSVKQ